MQIFIKTLTGYTYNFDVEGMDTILSLKEKYYDKSGTPIDQQRLVYKGHELDDDATLASYEIEKESTIFSTLRLGGPPQNVLWKPFIKEMNIQAMATDVDVNIEKITIIFQSHKNKKINIKGLVNSTDINGEVHKMQNVWINYLAKTHGKEKAKSFFWNKTNYAARIMVVKLREEFVEKGDKMLEYIEQEKYNIFGINKTYYGGDNRSWQRYTEHIPINAMVKGIKQQGYLEYRFEKKLEEDTWYALLLLHNNQYYDDAIYEDLVVPFKTSREETLVFKMNDYE